MMGVVYEADDPALGRTIALKTIQAGPGRLRPRARGLRAPLPGRGPDRGPSLPSPASWWCTTSAATPSAASSTSRSSTCTDARSPSVVSRGSARLARRAAHRRPRRRGRSATRTRRASSTATSSPPTSCWSCLRRAEDHGLRHRQARGRPAHVARPVLRHSALHVAGAGARPGGRRPHGPVLAGLGGVPAAGRPAALRGAQRARDPGARGLPASEAAARRRSRTARRVEYVVARAMAKNPADRYPTGASLAEDVEDILAGRPPRHRERWKAPETGAGRSSRRAGTSCSSCRSSLSARSRRPAGDAGRRSAWSRSWPWWSRRTSTCIRQTGGSGAAPPPRAGARASPKSCARGGHGSSSSRRRCRRRPRAGRGRVPSPMRGTTAGGQSARRGGPGRGGSHRSQPRLPLVPDDAAEARPATLALEFEHHLRRGHLQVWVDDARVVDQDFDGRVTRRIVGLELRKGVVQQQLTLSPGPHDVRVRSGGTTTSSPRASRGRSRPAPPGGSTSRWAGWAGSSAWPEIAPDPARPRRRVTLSGGGLHGAGRVRDHRRGAGGWRPPCSRGAVPTRRPCRPWKASRSASRAFRPTSPASPRPRTTCARTCTAAARPPSSSSPTSRRACAASWARPSAPWPR